MIEIKPGLVIGLPVRSREIGTVKGLIQPEVAFSWSQLQFPMNTVVAWAPVRGFPRDQARNSIAEDTVRLGAPYLFFLDDDVQAPAHAPRCLIDTMKQAPGDVMVVGGVYTGKMEPTEPMVYVGGNGLGAHWKWKAGDIFDCHSIATGCMLIKTEVFKHIEKPWFRDAEGETEGWTLPNKAEGAGMNMTDDLWFCEKVKAAGFKILCDSRVLCGHWDVANDKCYELGRDSYPMRPREEAHDQLAHQKSA
jgi:hypothetical protein